jgi:hypothetical protein
MNEIISNMMSVMTIMIVMNMMVQFMKDFSKDFSKVGQKELKEVVVAGERYAVLPGKSKEVKSMFRREDIYPRVEPIKSLMVDSEEFLTKTIKKSDDLEYALNNRIKKIRGKKYGNSN